MIPRTLDLLEALDIPLSVPAVQIDQAEVEAGGPRIEMFSKGCCWVIRRWEFDEMLLEVARGRGLEVRTGVRVRDARREGERTILETSGGRIEARVVVAADGSGSLLRRRLVDPSEGWVARAVTADVPMEALSPPDAYEFDFREVPRGLAGYAWSFPCWIEGRPHWNVGVYSVRRRGEGVRIAELLDRRGATAARRAHPIRLYEAGRPLAAPGVVLVGDAAGVDPLLGEGISHALEYGRLAAVEIAEAFGREEFDFAGYTQRVARAPLGKMLRLLGLGARFAYGSKGKWCLRLARLSRTAQRIGMNHYNGVGLWSPPVETLAARTMERSTGAAA